MRILILGVTGMLGSAIHKIISHDRRHETWGTLRNDRSRRYFAEIDHARLIDGVDVTDLDSVETAMRRICPDIVINAVGVIKQLPSAKDPLIVLPINAMFPHRLAGLCRRQGSRMIQLSSDCVFSGRTGNYVESDVADADDLYGRSKFIGEVHDHSHVVTLRTSGIGHEFSSTNGLLEWFLSQNGQVKGFTNAIYSGLPSVELGRVIRDFVLPRADLTGLYHVSSKPISKFDLLRLIADVYEKKTAIEPDEALSVDRSLNSARFTAATGYMADEWPALVEQMRHSRA